MAFLYLMEVKENIDSIMVDDLEKSYFLMLLKSIVINIQALINLGFIKNDITIQLNRELICLSVYNLIKKLEFNKINNEQGKQLINRL